MAKKTPASRARSTDATRKPAATAKAAGSTSSRKAPTARKAASAPSKASKAGKAPADGSVKKHVGDVIGLGRARVSKSVPEGTRRPKGIEIATTGKRAAPRPAKAVGGVRGRGR